MFRPTIRQSSSENNTKYAKEGIIKMKEASPLHKYNSFLMKTVYYIVSLSSSITNKY